MAIKGTPYVPQEDFPEPSIASKLQAARLAEFLRQLGIDPYPGRNWPKVPEKYGPDPSRQ